jgi:hypothetical protein
MADFADRSLCIGYAGGSSMLLALCILLIPQRPGSHPQGKSP